MAGLKTRKGTVRRSRLAMERHAGPLRRHPLWPAYHRQRQGPVEVLVDQSRGVQRHVGNALDALPPNMRKLDDCPRERSPIILEVMLDGETIYNKTMLPPGIFNDGGVNIYFNSKVPAGKHSFKIKMDDSVRKQGFNHILEQDINIDPAHILLVEFEPLTGFVLK